VFEELAKEQSIAWRILTKEGNIIRAEDVELMINQAEREITESQASKALGE
jgi:hypothetical protein